MTAKICLSIVVLTLAACNGNRKDEKTIPETPKALEDKSSSYDVVSKRGNEDLVENLYKELVSKDKDLKKLEDRVRELSSSQSDSTELFDNYNEKNQDYFRSAERHLTDIKDSLVREKMKNLVALQLANYNSRIARHNELVKIIQERQITIADLVTLLKITRTLPLIEKYQKDNLPGTKSLDGYIKEQEAVIKLADSLAGK